MGILDGLPAEVLAEVKSEERRNRIAVVRGQQ
jgi:hypothetical protein